MFTPVNLELLGKHTNENSFQLHLFAYKSFSSHLLMHIPDCPSLSLFWKEPFDFSGVPRWSLTAGPPVSLPTSDDQVI
jgi:hypothetical protein